MWMWLRACRYMVTSMLTPACAAYGYESRIPTARSGHEAVLICCARQAAKGVGGEGGLGGV
jgi:hypothetical protein